MYWGNKSLQLQSTKLVMLERISEPDIVSIQQIFNIIPLPMFLYLSSFPSECIPTFHNETFAIIYMQPNNMQGEHWMVVANFRHKIFFQILCRQTCSFLKQQYKQMMPEPLQSEPSVWDFYTKHRVFHLFMFWQEETTGVHDVNVLWFIGNYMSQFILFSVNVQVIQWFGCRLYSETFLKIRSVFHA